MGNTFQNLRGVSEKKIQTIPAQPVAVPVSVQTDVLNKKYKKESYITYALLCMFVIISVYLFFLANKKITYNPYKHKDPFHINAYTISIPKNTKCFREDSLVKCENDDDCTKCAEYNNNKKNITCRSYLNTIMTCKSVDDCDLNFCDIKKNDKGVNQCVAKKFCLQREPLEVCNKKNGGEFVLTQIQPAGPDNDVVQKFTCTCAYPHIASHPHCELNPDVCKGGTWIFDAHDNCGSQLNKTSCLTRPGVPEHLSRRSCQWIGSSNTSGRCIKRAPDADIDCICSPSQFLLIKDKGVGGKQNVPYCVNKSKTSCANKDMCENFHSNIQFSNTNGPDLQPIPSQLIKIPSQK